MKCSNCGKENDESSKFCNNCGSELIIKPEVLICSNCGKENDESSKFCNRCGSSLEIEPQNIICSKCGAELEEGSIFCSSCGSSTPTKPKKMTEGRKFKDEVVADYENEDLLLNKYRNRVTGSKLLNKFTDALVDVGASAGVLNKSTRNFNSKLIGPDYVEAFERLTDEEKAVWNAKLGDDDLIWAIRKMDYDDQIRYLPIFIKEVKDIVAAPDYDYVEFFKQVQKGAIKGGFGGLPNTWSRQRELEKQIEEYYK